MERKYWKDPLEKIIKNSEQRNSNHKKQRGPKSQAEQEYDEYIRQLKRSRAGAERQRQEEHRKQVDNRVSEIIEAMFH